MLFSTNTQLFRKYYTITADDDCLCFRILTPSLSQTRSYQKDRLLTTDSLVDGKCIIDDKVFAITHEIFIHRDDSRDDSLWTGGKHLVLYGTSDSLLRGKVLVKERSAVDYDSAEVFVEIIVPSKSASMKDADFLLSIDADGQVLTNLPSDQVRQIERDQFALQFSATVPNAIKKTGGAQIAVTCLTPSGTKISGTVEFDALAGFLPDRRVEFSAGAGSLIILAMYAPKEVCVCHKQFTITIPVEN